MLRVRGDRLAHFDRPTTRRTQHDPAERAPTVDYARSDAAACHAHLIVVLLLNNPTASDRRERRIGQARPIRGPWDSRRVSALAIFASWRRRGARAAGAQFEAHIPAVTDAYFFALRRQRRFVSYVHDTSARIAFCSSLISTTPAGDSLGRRSSILENPREHARPDGQNRLDVLCST